MSHENGDDPDDGPKTHRDYRIARDRTGRLSKPEENDDPVDPSANFDGVGDDDWQNDVAKGLLEDLPDDMVKDTDGRTPMETALDALGPGMVSKDTPRPLCRGRHGPGLESDPDGLATEEHGLREVKAYAEVDPEGDGDMSICERRTVAICRRLGEQFPEDELEAAIGAVAGDSPPTLREYRERVLDRLEYVEHPPNAELYLPGGHRPRDSRRHGRARAGRAGRRAKALPQTGPR